MSRLPGRLRPVHWTAQSLNYDCLDEADPDVPVWIGIAEFDALWQQTNENSAQAGDADDNQPKNLITSDEEAELAFCGGSPGRGMRRPLSRASAWSWRSVRSYARTSPKALCAVTRQWPSRARRVQCPPLTSRVRGS